MKNFIENYKCKQVQDFIDGNIKNLFIFGQCGTGKSYALDYIASKRSGKKFLATEYIARMNEYLYNWKNATPQDQYFWPNLQNNVLYFDDLGAEGESENNQTLVYRLLEEARPRAMAIVSNLKLLELQKRYDDRIMSRLIGNFKFIEFQGDDWRTKNFTIEKPIF